MVFEWVNNLWTYFIVSPWSGEVAWLTSKLRDAFCQSVPLSKTVHRTVFEIHPCKGLYAKVFRRLRTAKYLYNKINTAGSLRINFKKLLKNSEIDDIILLQLLFTPKTHWQRKVTLDIRKKRGWVPAESPPVQKLVWSSLSSGGTEHFIITKSWRQAPLQADRVFAL